MDVEFGEGFCFRPWCVQFHSIEKEIGIKNKKSKRKILFHTLVTTRLFRNIFIANIRCVVLSRQRTTFPNVPRPRIFKYSKSFICWKIKRNLSILDMFSKNNIFYWSSCKHVSCYWIFVFYRIRITICNHFCATTVTTS